MTYNYTSSAYQQTFAYLCRSPWTQVLTFLYETHRSLNHPFPKGRKVSGNTLHGSDTQKRTRLLFDCNKPRGWGGSWWTNDPLRAPLPCVAHVLVLLYGLWLLLLQPRLHVLSAAVEKLLTCPGVGDHCPKSSITQVFSIKQFKFIIYIALPRTFKHPNIFLSFFLFFNLNMKTQKYTRSWKREIVCAPMWETFHHKHMIPPHCVPWIRTRD